MTQRITRQDLQDQLDRLNSLSGERHTLDRSPQGWKVDTGKQERRRPAKEMYDTLQFSIDLLERMQHNQKG